MGGIHFVAATSGKINEVVIFGDYPDLATYKQQEAAFHADPEVMDLWPEKRLSSSIIVW